MDSNEHLKKSLIFGLILFGDQIFLFDLDFFQSAGAVRRQADEVHRRRVRVDEAPPLLRRLVQKPAHASRTLAEKQVGRTHARLEPASPQPGHQDQEPGRALREKSLHHAVFDDDVDAEESDVGRRRRRRW